MAEIIEGPLSKWTNVMKGWRNRWFGNKSFIYLNYSVFLCLCNFFPLVLDDNAGLLSYYTVKTYYLGSVTQF